MTIISDFQEEEPSSGNSNSNVEEATNSNVIGISSNSVVGPYDEVLKPILDKKSPIGVLETVIDFLNRKSDLLKDDSVEKKISALVSAAKEKKKNTVEEKLLESVSAESNVNGTIIQQPHSRECDLMAENSSSELQVPFEKLQSLSVNSEVQQASSSSNPNSSRLNGLTLEERFKIVRSIGEECIQEDELLNLLEKKLEPICYDGFEPSGRMHIAQGVMKTINVNKLTSAGCKVKIWIADWFAFLNNKMGGDLKKIWIVGEYLIEIWKAAGMNLDGVEFLWSSDEINSRGHEYWPLVFDIARKNNLPRITRCCQIMGRNDQDLTAAQIIYPCMQCADIFFLKADICQLGMDQRKVNMLAREYCAHIKRKNKPIILSHHMLPGLQEGQEKMSKSDPSSSIFMEDEEAEVNVKIKKAYCPPKLVQGNPCLEYIKYIIFPWFGEFEVERLEEKGGNKSFKTFEELVADYEREELHPKDLKDALSKALNKILQPVRDHFKQDAKAKDLLKKVKTYITTR